MIFKLIQIDKGLIYKYSNLFLAPTCYKIIYSPLHLDSGD